MEQNDPLSVRWAKMHGMEKWILWVALGQMVLSAVALSRAASAEDTIDVGHFSAASAAGTDSLPEGWEAMTFGKGKRPTRYRLVADGETTVLRADSEQSSSGLIHRVEVDVRKYPLFRWRWKVMNVLSRGDATRKQGDDYPGRVYIMFKSEPAKLGFFERVKYEAARMVYGEYPPLCALIYIWANKASIGDFIPNPFTARAKMIVVESGEHRLGGWIEEERDIYADFRRAFGDEPTPVNGVAVMTDSDNTSDSATAYYGDMTFRGP